VLIREVQKSSTESESDSSVILSEKLLLKCDRNDGNLFLILLKV